MPAVQLLLDHRSELFPGIPIVLCFSEFSARPLEQLPPGVTGVTTKPDFAGTLELMSRLHPDMQQIAAAVVEVNHTVGSYTSLLFQDTQGNSEVIVRDQVSPAGHRAMPCA